MANVVSFSGGRTSAYMAHLLKRMEKAGEIDNLHFVFMDTGAEHPKTYEFVKQCNDAFDLNLVCLRTVISMEKGVGPQYRIVSIDDIGHDLTPWRDMGSKYGMPYIHGAFCTDRMKTTPYYKYCNDTFGKGNYTTWLGIRIDEGRRLKPKDNTRYLAEVSPMDKLDILGFWSDMPFDLDIEEYEGNCLFCIKKGTNRIALAARANPELADDFIRMIESDTVRIVESAKHPKQIMYRGDTSLEQIIQTYSIFTDEAIKQSMRGNTSSCNESCEVFGCQVDMFDEQKTGTA